jgi:hypothetical protein
LTRSAWGAFNGIAREPWSDVRNVDIVNPNPEEERE